MTTPVPASATTRTAATTTRRDRVRERARMAETPPSRSGRRRRWRPHVALFTGPERCQARGGSQGGAAMARTMDRVEVDEAAVQDLAGGFRGELVRPPD